MVDFYFRDFGNVHSSLISACLSAIPEAMGTMTHPKPSPRIVTTPSASSAASPSTPALASSASRHKHRGSFASPIEVLSKSPTARRMSQSVYSQSGTVLPEGMMDIRRIWDHPVLLAGALIASIMFCGIVYSLIFSTSLDTSLPTSHLTPDRLNAPYLARKSNIPNQVFVKYSWAWTSLAFIVHFVSSPPSSSSRSVRLAAFGLNTLAWLIFTTWFFGDGLGDRVIAMSGGRCGITVPTEWGLKPESLSHLSPVAMDPSPSLGVPDSGPFLLPLPASFCSTKLALTPSTHPSLFEVLKSAMDPHLLSRTRMPQPRWHKGFDISGHAFLLTLGGLVLVRELAPSWRSMLRTARTPHGSGRSASIGRGGPVHSAAVVLATALLGLWIVMLGTTAVYFHNPSEKLSGLGLGLATTTLINVLTPESSSILAHMPQVSESIPEDENLARRGRVVDDGVILDNDVDEALSHPKSE